MKRYVQSILCMFLVCCAAILQASDQRWQGLVGRQRLQAQQQATAQRQAEIRDNQALIDAQRQQATAQRQQAIAQQQSRMRRLEERRLARLEEKNQARAREKLLKESDLRGYDQMLPEDQQYIPSDVVTKPQRWSRPSLPRRFSQPRSESARTAEYTAAYESDPTEPLWRTNPEAYELERKDTVHRQSYPNYFRQLYRGMPSRETISQDAQWVGSSLASGVRQVGSGIASSAAWVGNVPSRFGRGVASTTSSAASEVPGYWQRFKSGASRLGSYLGSSVSPYLEPVTSRASQFRSYASPYVSNFAKRSEAGLRASLAKMPPEAFKRLEDSQETLEEINDLRRLRAEGQREQLAVQYAQ